ncbi:MAG: YkgJ family cysteine cluster protein [Desulfarculaceae bacterium]|nr:YkgJ family cysteine cluster protein [Desulfarculaceae bacterium]MCF8073759.1 YkgJ family cysteine cluster protein [Desulfarculaceae bacterium]MCF8102000.1 YkgJ family cysteine cluster protein [Desulfarculaceae bacterium]MCF8115970.1 YkgJ family cysteine cluster protein [Desulfarculaceae bacterium]
MIETSGELQGRPLAPDQSFCFACRPGLACFNSCCTGKRLPLLPYDFLRLRQALDLPAAEVLSRHVELEADPVSGWPALRIKLTPEGACPFVSEQGCAVYLDRPTCCRIYPLARAVRPGKGGRPPREVFLRQDTPGCLGWDQPEELTIAAWTLDQGLAPYQAANNQAMGLFMHPARQGEVSLNDQQTHAFISALYNLEAFRPLAASPGFGEKFGFSQERLAEALADDEALLSLGVDWLTGVFFGKTKTE